MAIFRSTDPTTFDDIDQVVINETAPPKSISGIASNIAILVGRFQRGPASKLIEIGSKAELLELYGPDGHDDLRNKRFGRLRLVRVIAVTGSAKSTVNLDDGVTTDILQFDALFEGAYGDNLQVKVEAGTDSGKKYTFHDNNPGAVLADEVFDNIVVTDIDSQTFLSSKLMAVTVLATSAEPADVAFTNLASGSDGTEADSDYEPALAVLEEEGSGNIVWADKQSSTVKDALEQHVANMPDKIAIIAPDSSAVDQATAITEVANYRTDRMIYSYPYLRTRLSGVETVQAPASWYASVLSQLGPQVDPATVDAVDFTGGIIALEDTITRANHINLKDNGISAWEFDSDFGFKIKSGVVASLVSGKTQVLRRRMADFLTNSIGKFLKQYQNKVNSKAQRDLVKAAITNFDKRLENEGILPGSADVSNGSPVLIDTDSLNSNDSIALGFFKILYRRRIFSAMRFIVLQAEIGQGVLITEAD